MRLFRTLLAGGLLLAASIQPALAEESRHRFIVVLDEESIGLAHELAADRQRTVTLTNRLARNVSAQGGVRPRAILGHLGMFVVDATRSQAERLANLPGVRLVEEDTLAEPSGLPSCFSPTTFPQANSYDPISPQSITCWDPFTSCSDSWALDRIDQRTGNQAAHTLDSKFYFGARGNGVHIYVLDTGLVATHSEFALAGGGTRVGNGTNFAITGQCPPNQFTTSCGDRPAWDTYDGNGHGTLVTSVAAGRRFGVAKSAIVHPVRVANNRGRSWTSWEAFGLDWVAANAIRPAVVNLSVNFDINPSNDTTSVDLAVLRLINNYGIPVVNSAGNKNSPVVNYSPTALPEVIVVAGIHANNKRYGWDAPLSCTAEFCGSNWGSQVDLFAPSVDIIGAMASSGQSYACIGTGTSFAAPLVTGVVAQYLETNPTASPALVQTVLIERATTGAVQGELRGSPNRLLYTDF
ncbi:MAG TPA: S8 family serine peptidase [Thermoanaerobaculia bacterium]|nr:S8 family serine peptidase [Thermoanaerobaculia bacterium]